MPTRELDSRRDLGNLYSEHHGWLYSWLRKKLRCPHQAADLAHDTFFRLFSFSGLRDIQEPRAFLTTTASRLIIDAARRRKIEQKYLELCGDSHEAALTTPSPEELAVLGETLAIIAHMLEGLPPKCRQAFLMSRLDGMKHGDIADALGVSTSSVKKYIVTAMLHCYHIVREEGL